MGMRALSGVLVLLLFGAGSAASAQAPDLSTVPVGETIKLCEECPEFVRVPDAPEGLRPIRFVAKYPLTWNQYLASVDAGACTAPNSSPTKRPLDPPVADLVDQLRIDWPVTVLSQGDIACFAEWLDAKTGMSVVIPTKNEWEWFAFGDRQDAMFPWGDEEENPPAAVAGVEIAREDEFPNFQAWGASRLHYISGTRVGLFPPNIWGLYDVVGNVHEITSTIYSGEEWLAKNPGSFMPELTKTYDYVVVRGGSRNRSLGDSALRADIPVVPVKDQLFSADVAVRFVMVEGE